MNSDQKKADAIPLYAAVGEEDASIEAVERANKVPLKMACNEFLFKWVPPDMTILEFERVSCGLFARIVEEWEKKERRES